MARESDNCEGTQAKKVVEMKLLVLTFVRFLDNSTFRNLAVVVNLHIHARLAKKRYDLAISQQCETRSIWWICSGYLMGSKWVKLSRF